MARGTGDRGVSEVIGFILVFAFLVIAFTAYQGLVVPEQNRQVEFQHNQDVQGDLQDLRNAVLATASVGTGQSVSVEMGATYPTRAIAQNLGVSAGSVRTEDLGAVRLENARALDAETRDYLDGSTRTFATRSIRYRPVYSFYSTAPDTIYENTLVFNRFDGENITLTDQGLIDGRRITLVAVDGSLDAARQGTLSISPEAISASSNRVAVRNTTGEQVNVTVPTHLSAAAWREILEDEMGPAGYVDDVEPVPGGGAVKLVLQQGVTYDLRMANVGLGSSTAEEGPKYVTSVEGNQTSVPEGGRQKLVVEVRDRFNNPVSNVTVSLRNSPGWGSVSPGDRTTDSDGRATFTYDADPDVSQLRSDTVEFGFDGDGTANESVTFEVDVLDSDGSGAGGGGGGGTTSEANPSRSQGSLVYVRSEDAGASHEFDVLFETSGSSDVTIEEARFQFHFSFAGGQGGGASSDEVLDPADSLEIGGSDTMTYQGDMEDVGETVAAGGEQALRFALFDGGGGYDIEDGGFMVITVRTDADETWTYYITVPGSG